MIKLNKNKVYDLSELTSDEFKRLSKDIQKINPNKTCKKTPGWLKRFSEEGYKLQLNKDTGWSFECIKDGYTNAKELFYTLENIQVETIGLSSENIKKVKEVFEKYRYKVDFKEFILIEVNNSLSFKHNIGCVSAKNCYKEEDKITISFDKFMELFGEEKEDVRTVEQMFPNIKVVENNIKEHNIEKPNHYSKGIDTFERMEANCTKEECLAFVKGNIDKYNWREKGQDLEDFEKIISYANWAIKLIENGK